MPNELDESVYPVPLPIRRLEWMRIKRRLFTVAQCEELVRFATTKGRYYRSAGKQVPRAVDICYADVRDFPWAFEALAATFATENIWGFALTSIVEQLRIQRYRRGGYTKSHSDYDYASTDQSKITAIVPLVPKTSWAGGDFLLRGKKIRGAPDRGDCLLFPSFAWHGVSPVTRGERIVLSAWVAGPRLV
jgi:2-oxoglutarate-Fe(II)-dependent oxygenase superfamily protein